MISRLLCCLLLMSLAFQPVMAQPTHRDTLHIYFPFDRSVPVQGAWQKLDEFCDGIDWKAVTQIVVTGYTDTTGTTAYNKRLALQRAKAVEQHLSLPGPVKAVLQVGGETISAATDPLNRRVDLVVVSNTIAADSSTGRIGDTSVLVDSPSVDTAGARVYKVLELDKLYFVANQPVLTPESRSYLPSYIQMLQQFKGRRMEIAGHVNYDGREVLKPGNPLFVLSVQRARLIYDYLVEAGFDPALLSYKGYGNTRPVFPHPANLEEKQHNMRVEIYIY